MVNLPFEQERVDHSTVVRTFSASVPDEELKWHRDHEDRLVRPLEETDWQLQLDDELPKRFVGEVMIPKGVYHRLIKGSGDLKVEVKMLS